MADLGNVALLGLILAVLSAVGVSIVKQGGRSTSMQVLRLDERVRALELAIQGMAADLRSAVDSIKRSERVLDTIVTGALDGWGAERSRREHS